MRLYGITAEDIARAVDQPDSMARQGNKTVAMRKLARGFKGYPLR